MIRGIGAYEILCDCCGAYVKDENGVVTAYNFLIAAWNADRSGWTFVIEKDKELFASKSLEETLKFYEKLKPGVPPILHFDPMTLCPTCAAESEDLGIQPLKA